MKTRLICACVAAALAAWAPHGSARETVNLPGVVGAEGVLRGVDTTGAGTLTVAPDQNINTTNDVGGGIRQGAGSVADVRFGGSSTVTGDVGAPTLPAFTSPIFNINAGANASTVIFNGRVFSTTVNVTGTGTVIFNGNAIAATNFGADGFITLGAGQTLTGAVTTATANTGTFTLNGGSSVTGAIGGANGLKQINVVGGNASIVGAVQARGFSLGTNTLNIAGALTLNAGATVATSFANNAVFGNIAVAGNSNVTSAVTVIPTVIGPLTVGTTYTIVDGTAGGVIGTPVNVINNSPLFTFAGVPVNIQGDVQIILVAATPLAAVATVPGAAAVAPIVLSVPAPAGSDLATVQAAVFALPSIPAINTALAQLSPGTTNLAAPWVAAQVTRQFEDLWMARMDEIQDLCCDTCEPNRAASTHKCKGPEDRGSWWGKGFGREGRQDNVDNVNGYKTNAWGVMLAYDTPLNDQTRAGVGIGYARNTIDGNNASGRTEIDSYQATAYLAYTSRPWFVHGALIAGMDRYEGARPIVFPGVNRTAAADYDGHQYTGLVTAGTHLYNNRGFTFTPFASLQYSRVNVDSYAETGAGDVNLRVNSQDYDFIQSTLGVKAERVIRSGAGTFAPEVHFKWMHDFSSTTMQQNAAFAGGGALFTTSGVKQDRDMYNVGAGITVLSCLCEKNTWTVKGLYDYKWTQSDYSSHQLSLILSAKF